MEFAPVHLVRLRIKLAATLGGSISSTDVVESCFFCLHSAGCLFHFKALSRGIQPICKQGKEWVEWVPMNRRAHEKGEGKGGNAGVGTNAGEAVEIYHHQQIWLSQRCLAHAHICSISKTE